MTGLARTWIASFGDSTLTQRPAPAPPRTRPDERAARRALLDQVARLEGEAAGPLGLGRPRRGARLMSLGELEELRDDMVGQVARGRAELAERARSEEQSRRLIEEILLDPESHRWVRVSNEHIGEPGCRHWHVRPRFGLLGILMRWWRVVVSSGCP
jgi:hypothetical protein